MYLKKKTKPSVIDIDKVYDTIESISCLLTKFKFTKVLEDKDTIFNDNWKSIADNLFNKVNILADCIGYRIVIEYEDPSIEVTYDDVNNINYDICKNAGCIFDPFSSSGEIMGYLYDLASTCFLIRKIVILSEVKSDDKYKWDQFYKIDVYKTAAYDTFGNVPVGTVFAYRFGEKIQIMVKMSEVVAQFVADKDTIYGLDKSITKIMDFTSSIAVIYKPE